MPFGGIGKKQSMSINIIVAQFPVRRKLEIGWPFSPNRGELSPFLSQFPLSPKLLQKTLKIPRKRDFLDNKKILPSGAQKLLQFHQFFARSARVLSVLLTQSVSDLF
jgi:hypothetical protein